MKIHAEKLLNLLKSKKRAFLLTWIQLFQDVWYLQDVNPNVFVHSLFLLLFHFSQSAICNWSMYLHIEVIS